MMAELLHSLTDDNPDLQKQTGCITGIFQWFDRHQMSGSERRNSNQRHRRTHSRHSQFTDGRLEGELNVAHQRQLADMNSSRLGSDRRRFSTESSRASFSSSPSSSFSSVDYYRSTQPDPAYNDRSNFSEGAFDDSHCSVFPKIAQYSVEYQKVVEEARGLSIKTTSKEENMNCASKRGNALRNLRQFGTVGGARTCRNHNMLDHLNEPIEVTSALQGAEWIYHGHKEQRRMSDHGYKPKDSSRISYNEMETRRLSFDSRETISASKLRDLPRLSLDGRKSLMHSIDCTVSNFELDTSLKKYSIKEKGVSQLEVPGTQQLRSPSLIAKLMGLTALPDTNLATQTNRQLDKTQNVQGGMYALNHRKSIFNSKTPSSTKVSDFPRWISSEVKPISSSRVPVEQAPWKNQEKGVSLLKQSPRKIRHSNPNPSVYSEIEKRFKNIEFNNSGKDLRALKQILESIHAKELMENEKQEQASKFAIGGKQESALINLNQSATASQLNAQRQHLAEAVTRHAKSSRPSNLQSVIMKSVSGSPRSQSSKNMSKDQVFSSHEKCKSTQSTVKSEQQPKDNSPCSPRNLGAVSPRVRLKKLEFEKQTQVQNQASDGNKHRMQVSKQPTESSSPGRKVQQRLLNKQQSSSQMSEIVLEIKKTRSQTNEASLPTDKNVALDLKKDKHATHTIRATKINGSHSPSKKASKPVGLASNKSTNHINLSVKHDETAPEHPSPVSVLNLSPYMEDSSTEEKQLATPPEELAESYLRGELGITSKLSRKKLLSIDNLVTKLKQLNTTHDESRTDYIASLCDNSNPDHRYISEILLASGILLREFGSNAKPFQLHSSGFIINPELFNVLEQTKSSTHISKKANADESKSHRKLIFDAVNEILTNKLATNGDFTDYTVKHHKLAKKVLSSTNLIKEICAEIEQLQMKKKQENKMETEDEKDVLKNMLREDVLQSSSDNWNAFEEGMSEVVLDIERSLFKKLVSEIVISEYNRVRPKSGIRYNRFIK